MFRMRLIASVSCLIGAVMADSILTLVSYAVDGVFVGSAIMLIGPELWRAFKSNGIKG